MAAERKSKRTNKIKLICLYRSPTVGDVQALDNTAHSLRNDVCWWHHLQQIFLLGVIQIAPLSQIPLLSIRCTNRGQTQSLREALHGFRSHARLSGVQYEMRCLFLLNTLRILVTNYEIESR